MVPFHRKLNVVPILVLCLFSVLLFGCGGNIPQTTQFEQPVVRPFQPLRVVQVCLDIPPHFSGKYVQEAEAMIADKVDASVTVNQGGLVIDVSYIRPLGVKDVALPTLSIPAIPADPKLTFSNDPVFQAKLKANHQLVTSTRAQVKLWTDALRSLYLPHDPASGDVNHCLEDATLLFSSTQMGYDMQRTVIIASFLDPSAKIDGKVDLYGATLNFIFCLSGTGCDYIELAPILWRRETWTILLRRRGTTTCQKDNERLRKSSS